MSRAILLDTHAWVWTLAAPAQLSPRARDAIAGADAVLVSPISFYEIGQKVRIGKWPDMAPLVVQLPRLLTEQGGQGAPLTPEIALEAACMDWNHRDPFDRILAATARVATLPLITKDPAFAGLADLALIW